MKTEEIIAGLEPVPERHDDRVKIFIPASLAAVCADCQGIFLVTARRCPGCGSAQFFSQAGNDVTLTEGGVR